MDDAVDRMLADVERIDGVSVKDPVRRAFRAVPRHAFIPEVALAVPGDGPPRLIDRESEPHDWWQAVYTDTSIVTQLDDGATSFRDLVDQDGALDLAGVDYSSSASAPSAVAYLLELLGPEPDHRVLEIGTGTGWTAALLSHLVGERNVTSIEVDAAVAEGAAKNLAKVGVQPFLVVGDGGRGCPGRAPYDRVHVTCGIRAVPYGWVEQVRPGGVIVAPYCPGFGSDHALRLVVDSEGIACGRFPGFASYMMMRSQRVLRTRRADPAREHYLATVLDPRIVARASAGADLAISALTGLKSRSSAAPDEDGELYRMWVSDPDDPDCWAAVDWRPGRAEYEVYQVGGRPVWEEVVDAYSRWRAWGEPGRDRFGMTVTPEGRQVWLDSPGRVVG